MEENPPKEGETETFVPIASPSNESEDPKKDDAKKDDAKKEEKKVTKRPEPNYIPGEGMDLTKVKHLRKEHLPKRVRENWQGYVECEPDDPGLKVALVAGLLKLSPFWAVIFLISKHIIGIIQCAVIAEGIVSWYPLIGICCWLFVVVIVELTNIAVVATCPTIAVLRLNAFHWLAFFSTWQKLMGGLFFVIFNGGNVIIAFYTLGSGATRLRNLFSAFIGLALYLLDILPWLLIVTWMSIFVWFDCCWKKPRWLVRQSIKLSAIKVFDAEGNVLGYASYYGIVKSFKGSLDDSDQCFTF